MNIDSKICSHCKEEKPLTDFHKGTGKMQKRSQCKKCSSILYNTPERKLKKNENRQKKRKNDLEYRLKEYELVKNSNRKNPLKYLLRVAKHRAKVRNLEFSITEKDLVLPEYCPLLNIQLQVNDDKLKSNSFSLDRIDNDRGYIPGNVWIISMRANFIKNNANLEELELLVKNLKEKWEH